jgi:hypothetical protein
MATFLRWYNNLPTLQQTKFEFNSQSFTDGLSDTYIGFLYRKDYPKYHEFKQLVTELINKLESSKD